MCYGPVLQVKRDLQYVIHKSKHRCERRHEALAGELERLKLELTKAESARRASAALAEEFRLAMEGV